MPARLEPELAHPTPCRLLIDPPAPGPWNMAVDEVLFAWAGQTGCACWRFYRWDRPTLSLGYFQAYPSRRELPAIQGCPVVRRLSGGGAILHDRELTYSLVLPIVHRLAKRRLFLYRTVHATLVETLGDRGIAASILPAGGPRPTGRTPFLCFQRRSPGDVVVGPTKIAGSAQRRSATAVLQHGSVLLRRSPAAPQLLALEEATGAPLPEAELIPAWLDRLATRLNLHWRPEPLSRPEKARAARLVQTKYASDRWTRHRRAGRSARGRP